MELTFSNRGRFVPKWHDNREQDPSEQISLDFDYLDFNQRRKHIHKDKPKLTIDNIDAKTDAEIDREILSQHSRFEITISTDDDAIVRDMRPTINNLKANGVAIDTWTKLLALPMTPENDLEALVRECTDRLSSLVREEGDLKNSE